MSAERYIAQDVLAQMLRVSTGLIRLWHEAGYLATKNMYRASAVNTVLRARAEHFGKHPVTTIESLLDGQDTLLTVEEVAARLNVSAGTAARRTSDGTLPILRLGERGAIRIPLSGLKNLITRLSRNDLVDAAFVSRVICREIQEVYRLVREGVFVKVRDPRSKKIWVTGQSLFDYLSQEGVLFHTTPAKWCDIRLHHDDEMISPHIMTQRFRLDRRRMPRILTSGIIPYIKLPGGWIRLPARFAAIAEFELNGLRPNELSELFNVDESMARTWRRERRFCRDDHVSIDRLSCPRPACIRAYVANNATHPSLQPDEWWRAIMYDGVPLATEDEAAAVLQRSSLQDAVAQGRLVGIRLPLESGPDARQALRFLWTDVIALSMR